VAQISPQEKKEESARLLLTSVFQPFDWLQLDSLFLHLNFDIKGIAKL
jgi:hypothetical protein